MSRIIGVTVGTPTSPSTMQEAIRPVKSVNGMLPDDKGNVVVETSNAGSKEEIQQYVSEQIDSVVPVWARQEDKPEYTAEEVGALSDTTTLKDLENDAGFITLEDLPDLESCTGMFVQDDEPEDAPDGSIWIDTDENPRKAANSVTPDEMKAYVNAAIGGIQLNETDPTVPDWAKAEEKPSYAASEIAANMTIDEQKCENVDAALNALANRSVGGGSCLDLEDFELIDTIDFSTEEMSQMSASKSYTVDNVLEVVFVWKRLQNISSSTYVTLRLWFNEHAMPSLIRTAPANINMYGYSYYKVLKNLGIMYWSPTGAADEPNNNGCNGQIPYNLPTKHSEPITSIKIANESNASYIVTSGTVEIYVR